MQGKKYVAIFTRGIKVPGSSKVVLVFRITKGQWASSAFTGTHHACVRIKEKTHTDTVKQYKKDWNI